VIEKDEAAKLQIQKQNDKHREKETKRRGETTTDEASIQQHRKETKEAERTMADRTRQRCRRRAPHATHPRPSEWDPETCSA